MSRPYFQIPAREVRAMESALFRQFPADPATHLYRSSVPMDTLPETGERESLTQVFAGSNTRRRTQRARALAWLFQRRGIEA